MKAALLRGCLQVLLQSIFVRGWVHRTIIGTGESRKGEAEEMKKSTLNKFISVMVGVAMCPMMLPTTAFAANDAAASGGARRPRPSWFSLLASRKTPIRAQVRPKRLPRSPSRREKRPMRRPPTQPKPPGKAPNLRLRKLTARAIPASRPHSTQHRNTRR